MPQKGTHVIGEPWHLHINFPEVLDWPLNCACFWETPSGLGGVEQLKTWKQICGQLLSPGETSEDCMFPEGKSWVHSSDSPWKSCKDHFWGPRAQSKQAFIRTERTAATRAHCLVIQLSAKMKVNTLWWKTAESRISSGRHPSEITRRTSGRF